MGLLVDRKSRSYVFRRWYDNLPTYPVIIEVEQTRLVNTSRPNGKACPAIPI
jgi:hypothetical protein